MASKFKRGETVIRLGSASNYVTGRVGEVVQSRLNVVTGYRYQIHWTHDSAGREIINGAGGKGVKTWVREPFLNFAPLK